MSMDEAQDVPHVPMPEEAAPARLARLEFDEPRVAAEKERFFQVGRDFEASNVSHKFTRDELRFMEEKYQSLDYGQHGSVVYKGHIEGKKVQTSSAAGSEAKWAMFLIVGAACGLMAFLLYQCIEGLGKLRRDLFLEAIDSGPGGWWFVGWLWWVGSAVLMSGVSSCIVALVAPAAAGSGVPDVMGYLNGVSVPKVFNVKTFAAKFFSCVLAVSSGLPVGPEGPIIHMGALLGAAIPTGRSKSMKFSFGEKIDTWFKQFRQPKEHRDFISGGAAAGVAAAFSAPVGGLLFVLEEVASFWELSLTWMVFMCCLVSCFIKNFLGSLFEGWERNEVEAGYFAYDQDVLFPLNTDGGMFHVLTLLPMTGVALVGGALGAIFTFFNLKVMRYRIKFFKNKHPLTRTVEVMLIAIVFATLMYCMGTQFNDCVAIPPQLGCEFGGGEENKTEPALVGDADVRDGLCEMLKHQVCEQEDRHAPKVYSPMATLAFSSGDEFIKLMFSSTAYGVEPPAGTLLCFFLVYFVFACLSAGSLLSSGLVVPMLVIGSCYGRAMGMGVELGGGSALWVDGSIFAVLGAAAFFGGVSRLTISLAVIVLEITGALHFLLPVMASVLMAKWVADFFTHSLYHSILEIKCVPFIDVLCTIPKMECFEAGDIMKTPVRTIGLTESVGAIVRLLRSCEHNGFPVVCPDTNQFRGLILRSHLLSLVHLAASDELDSLSSPRSNGSAPVSPLSPGSPGGGWTRFDKLVGTINQKLSHNEDVGDSDLPAEVNDRIVHVADFANMSTFTVTETFAINVVRNLFRTMGLRHLPVVNSGNAVVGIITRKDLIGCNIEAGMAKAVEKGRDAEYEAPPAPLPMLSVRSSQGGDRGVAPPVVMEEDEDRAPPEAMQAEPVASERATPENAHLME
eukprot:TRINITY_DN25024_c0_g1_i1.p1 TRINITY_DN25024_c0_g1~~TRINITY_DN25024_c0_g1_i1.p1  ORF type:complete len:904 (+),score=328.67 TRINITY_DN25024_c0_g1_i1:42-2753(+)